MVKTQNKMIFNFISSTKSIKGDELLKCNSDMIYAALEEPKHTSVGHICELLLKHRTDIIALVRRSELNSQPTVFVSILIE